MIQFNLLPDIKLEYIKTKRTKQIVTLVGFGVTGLAIFIFVLLFLLVNIFQTQHISNLTENIDTKTTELKNVEDIDKILTVQNQLTKVNGLHEQKPAASRLHDFLIQVTPRNVKISNANVNFEENTMELTGSANTLGEVNTFVDTLKFTKYVAGETKQNAFSEVVLASFGVDDGDKNQRTSYGIELKFSEEIFNITQKVELDVPSIISTRSSLNSTDALFEPVPEKSENQGSGE